MEELLEGLDIAELQKDLLSDPKMNQTVQAVLKNPEALSQFKNFKAALDKGDWASAGAEGRDSRWYKQVTNRAERLMSRMDNVT